MQLECETADLSRDCPGWTTYAPPGPRLCSLLLRLCIWNSAPLKTWWHRVHNLADVPSIVLNSIVPPAESEKGTALSFSFTDIEVPNGIQILLDKALQEATDSLFPSADQVLLRPAQLSNRVAFPFASQGHENLPCVRTDLRCAVMHMLERASQTARPSVF